MSSPFTKREEMATSTNHSCGARKVGWKSHCQKQPLRCTLVWHGVLITETELTSRLTSDEGFADWG